MVLWEYVHACTTHTHTNYIINFPNPRPLRCAQLSALDAPEQDRAFTLGTRHRGKLEKSLVLLDAVLKVNKEEEDQYKRDFELKKTLKGMDEKAEKEEALRKEEGFKKEGMEMEHGDEDDEQKIPKQAAFVPETPIQQFLKHTRVEFDTGEDVWHAGVIQERLPGSLYNVMRVYDQEIFPGITEAQMRLITTPLKQGAIQLGMVVSARYSGDGQYYKARVEKASEVILGCFKLEFVEYESNEEVLLEHIRLVKMKEVAGDEAGNTAGFVVPEFLKILPTDTEKVRENKQKRLKGMRKKAKMLEKNKES